MGIGAWITVITIVISVWALLPRRRRVTASSRSLPVIPRQRQRRAPQPFLPLLATLLAQTAAQVASQVSEATRVARETWQRHRRAAHMSITMVAVPEKPIPQIPLLPVLGAGTTEPAVPVPAEPTGTTPQEPVEAVKTDALIRLLKESGVSANKIAEALGGRRSAALERIRQATTTEEA